MNHQRSWVEGIARLIRQGASDAEIETYVRSVRAAQSAR